MHGDSRRKVWELKKDLDFAGIPQRPVYGNLLDKCKIIPFNKEAFAPPSHPVPLHGCLEYLNSETPDGGRPTADWLREARLPVGGVGGGRYRARVPLVQRYHPGTAYGFEGLRRGPIMRLPTDKGNHMYSELALSNGVEVA
jgi:hypothetical protein